MKDKDRKECRYCKCDLREKGFTVEEITKDVCNMEWSNNRFSSGDRLFYKIVKERAYCNNCKEDITRDLRGLDIPLDGGIIRGGKVRNEII